MSTRKLLHPLFLFCLFLLLLNDWYLKPIFHNEITGKLSDFAGLFVLPYLASAMAPRYVNIIHVSTGLLFVFWKCPLSQPVIEYFNALGIPFYRTIDLSDCVALIMICVSRWVFDRSPLYEFQPVGRRVVLIISFFAVIATQMPPRPQRTYKVINKTYTFDISKLRMVSCLNAIQLKEISMLSRVSGGDVIFRSESQTFHYKTPTPNMDTLAMIIDYTKVADTDTIRYKSSFANIVITGNDSTSALKLISIYAGPSDEQRWYREEHVVKSFEKRVVKRIKGCAKNDL